MKSKEMKLYVLRRKNGVVDMEERHTTGVASGFVVRATSNTHARKLVLLHRGDEGPDVWLDRDKSTCALLKPEGVACVVLSDFYCAYCGGKADD